MYNRYLSQDDAPYVRAGGGNPQPSPQQSSNSRTAQPQGFSTDNNPPSGNPSPMDRIQNLLGLGGCGGGQKKDESMLRRLLARFHLEDVDTGDLMLLILLFFLLEEKADDELLIALGLLLIL